MELNKQIEDTIEFFRKNLPKELSDLIENGADEIKSLEIYKNATKAGDKIENFSLKNKEGLTKELSDYLKKGPVILTFYRGIWCPYCNLQLASYNKNLDKFKELGANLVALTPEGKDSKEALLQSSLPQEAKDQAVSHTDFDVLHDKNNEIAKKFGLTFTLPTAHIELLKMMNLDIEKANEDNSMTFSDPATYIIDKDFTIKWAFIPNNYRKRANPEEIIAALKSL